MTPDLQAVPSLWDGPPVAAMLADFFALDAIARESGEGLSYRDYLLESDWSYMEIVTSCPTPTPPR